ncbi:uncharacterized protein VTP21DRAFT_8362 [Calcarisporiella thermophila]|uniref:uncharacterized protein n=1 Tax=Calcarisporiella thermophila TaxID=911321 RepID=UPI003742C3CE
MPDKMLQKSPETIPDSFGDIMSARETHLSLPPEFTGLERIVLTANGNLQRILSAYYCAPVTVQILYNRPLIPDNADTPTSISSSDDDNVIPKKNILQRYRRAVNLLVRQKIVCHATSCVTITSSHILHLVRDRGVGIGQLFRYMDKLPEFELLRAGKSINEGRFWRVYRLSMDGVECKIKENFSSDMFEEGWLNRPGIELMGGEEDEEIKNILFS